MRGESTDGRYNRMARARVLILGGGFAGMAAVRALRHAVRVDRCAVTLVDRYLLRKG